MDRIEMIAKLKDILRDSLGWFVVMMLLMAYFMYRQQLTIDELKTDKKDLEVKYRSAYADGQDDAIKKVGEQIKVIQSMGIIINQSIEQQKQNNNENKKLNKQLDNLKHELQ